MTETKTSIGHMVASGLVEPIAQCECCCGPRETPLFLYAMEGPTESDAILALHGTLRKMAELEVEK